MLLLHLFVIWFFLPGFLLHFNSLLFIVSQAMQTPFRSYLQEMLALVCFTRIYGLFLLVWLVIEPLLAAWVLAFTTNLLLSGKHGIDK